MQNELPINKEMINQVSRALMRYPDNSIEDLVFLIKNNIEITPSNVSNFNQLAEGNPLIFNQLENITATITEQISQGDTNIIEQLPLGEQSGEHLNVLNEFIHGSGTLDQTTIKNEVITTPLDQLMPNNILETILPQINHLLGDRENSLIIHGNMTLEEVGNLLEQLDISEDIVKEMKQQLVKPMIEDTVRQALFFKMDHFSKPGEVKAYFDQLYQQVEQLSKSLRETPQGESVKSDAVGVKNGLKFIRNLNQNFQFLEMPLLMDDQLLDGKFYVLNNKNQKKESKESISVLMQLDFLNLKHLY
jgi:hypothetical protein